MGVAVNVRNSSDFISVVISIKEADASLFRIRPVMEVFRKNWEQVRRFRRFRFFEFADQMPRNECIPAGIGKFWFKIRVSRFDESTVIPVEIFDFFWSFSFRRIKYGSCQIGLPDIRKSTERRLFPTGDLNRTGEYNVLLGITEYV